MDWAPISEVELWDKIIKAEGRMSPQIYRLWEAIKVTPEKWAERSYGKAGGGFWVVAVIGRTAVWYNDIEDGFSRSSYTEFGKLDDYFCNQDDLEYAVQGVLNFIDAGVDSAGRCGAPIAGTYLP